MKSNTARMACIAAALLSFNRLAIASPTPHFSSDVRHRLAPRLETNFVGCDKPQKSKLEKSFADAAALAKIAYDMNQSKTITDAKPQEGNKAREMTICPLFFRSDQTRNNLDSKKYDGNKRGSWCQLGQHFKDFETGGHTLLHEMTHLDALAKAAGLPART